MHVEVEKIDSGKLGWMIRVHAPPLLNFIVIRNLESKISVSIPSCITTIEGAKSVSLALIRAIEEAEALLPNKPKIT